MDIQQQLERLNAEQREAVDYIDGPLLVIAGPGTGKTQLLSLRAAHILLKRDVAPQSILCLTFSSAGAEAMCKRLVELIGRDAYGIEVATFHGFAAGLRSRWPEYFERGALSTLVSELRRHEIVNSLLNALPPSNPLAAGHQNGVNARLQDALAFIGHFKRSGLTSDELRVIARQNMAFFDYAESDQELMALVNATIPRAADKKETFISDFETAIERIAAFCADDLKTPVVSTPGIYVPYAIWLRQAVFEAQLIDEDGKTTGFKELRDKVFEGTAKEGRSFKDRAVSERALAAADVYDAYQAALAEANLYDYDDMILEAIAAVQGHQELADALHERYQYIQVDEFQDTNGAQMRILELLAGDEEEPNIMAVCDDDQAIMRFQGATIECIQQFERRWHPHNVVLKTNYRSTPVIVDLGKSVAAQIESRLPSSAADKDIVAFRPDGEQVEFVETVYVSRDAELYAIAQDIRSHIDEGFISACDDPDEAIAVIAPKHASLKALIPSLNRFGIPFSYKETSNVFQMESMQTLLALMRFAAFTAMGRTERAAAQLPQIVAAREYGLSPQQCITFAAKANHVYHQDWLAALAASENERLTMLHAHLVEWAAGALSLPVRELVFAMSRPLADYYQTAAADDPWSLAEFNAGIRALLRFVEGELPAGPTEGAARLVDIVERMDELERYNVSIDATIALGRDGAVRLVSAHGSKGLEFDRVYMLDADDDTWHRGARSQAFFTSNMLIGNDKDDDDARRLLFVALTRAKREMELFRAGGRTLRELQGEINTVEAQPTPDVAADIIQASWQDVYALDTPEFASLVMPDLTPKVLSASALNDFVEYQDGAINSLAFPSRRMLRLPNEPSSTLEFGNHVHAFLEDYVNHVVKGDADESSLAADYRQRIRWMDYRKEEVESLAVRFDQIVKVFVPWLAKNLAGTPATEVKIEAMTQDGIPLFGYCDLLLVDEATRQVRVLDYKTGFNYPGAKPTTSYERQLQFYKLLLESSADYGDYTVVECVNLYVEPERGVASELHAPVSFQMASGEMGRLQALIRVVWRRIQEGDFDTSAFEQSEHKAEAVAHNLTSKGEPRKRMDHRLIQAAYEDWLIEQG